jgi:hypothetical protein
MHTPPVTSPLAIATPTNSRVNPCRNIVHAQGDKSNEIMNCRFDLRLDSRRPQGCGSGCESAVSTQRSRPPAQSTQVTERRYNSLVERVASFGRSFNDRHDRIAPVRATQSPSGLLIFANGEH